MRRVRRDARTRAGRRPHVLTLIDHLVAGGAERFAVDLACNLPADRFQRTICVTRMPQDWRRQPRDAALGLTVAQVEDAGVSILPLHRGSRFAVWEWGPLLQRLPDVDVLHAHQFGSNCWGTALGRLRRVPVVIAHEQTWSFRGGAIRKALDRHLIGRFADRFVTVSELDRRRMAEIEGLPAHKLVLIRNGIVPRAVTGHDVRAELGIPSAAPVLVALAMLRPQKALHVLLRALAQVREEMPDTVLLLAGGPLRDNPEADRLRSEIARLGLGESVRMLDRRDDVPDLLAAADIGVLSSNYEGTPLAILEYMEAGLPVVSTSVGGVSEFVDDGAHGLLVPPGDPAALAKALLRLLRDPEARAAMGRLGRARRRGEFDYAATLRRFADLYEELLRQNQDGAAALEVSGAHMSRRS
jgi:glycosyltransferase involved in cell wall biosynthesis